MATWKKVLTSDDGNIGSTDQSVPGGDDRTLKISSDGSTQFTSDKFLIKFDDVQGTTQTIAQFIGSTLANSSAGATSTEFFGNVSFRGGSNSTQSIGLIKLFEEVGDGSLVQNSVGIAAPKNGAMSASYTVYLPTAKPASGNHYLRGAAAGADVVTTWVAESSLGGGTTINNASVNRLVTVASTTTELDAESRLNYDASTQKLTATGTSLNFYPDADDGEVNGILIDAGLLATELNITGGNGSDRVAVGLWVNLPCTSSTLPQDKIISLDSNGDVIEAQSNVVGTSRGLMVLRLAAAASSQDFFTGLTYGIANVPNTMINGTFAKGGILYLSDLAAGEFTFLRPSSSGDIVRHMGYAVEQGTVDGVACTQIMFAPSSDFVELS